MSAWIPEVESKNRLLSFLRKYFVYKGAGAIVGYSRYTSSTIVATTATGTTPTYALNGSDKVSLTFAAPPSGVVELACSVMMNPGNNDYGILALSTDGASWSTYTPTGDPTDTKAIFYYCDESDLEYNTAKWVLRDLTPNQSYTFYLGVAVNDAAHTFEIRWGNTYPSMVLKATALPADTVLTDS